MSLLSGTLRELAGFTEALRSQARAGAPLSQPLAAGAALPAHARRGPQTDSVLVDQLTALERGPLEEVKALRKCVFRVLRGERGTDAASVAGRTTSGCTRTTPPRAATWRW